MKTDTHNKDTFSANRTLESVIWISAIVLLFILFSYSTAFANSGDVNSLRIKVTSKPNIGLVYNSLTSLYNLDEEDYIDDIPFDTAEINAEYKLLEFTLEAEDYIDDIPNEIQVTEIQFNYHKAISIEFCFEEEKFINDVIIY